MELDRTGGHFELTTFFRPLDANRALVESLSTASPVLMPYLRFFFNFSRTSGQYSITSLTDSYTRAGSAAMADLIHYIDNLETQ